MTVEIIMLGVIIVLLLYLVVSKFMGSSERRTLEKSVAIKKLKLNEKLLDQQLGGNGPDLASILRNAEVVDTTESPESKKQPIGYAR